MRLFKKRLLSSSLILIILTTTALFWATRPAQADMAPPPPPIGSNPFTDTIATQVQMVSEVVTFDVADNSPNTRGFAKVSAVFNMHNNGSQAETMVARFPLCTYFVDQCMWSPEPSINDLAVWVNGISASVTTTTASVQTTDSSYKDIPAWGNFKVTFPAGQDMTILVTYTAWAYIRDYFSADVEYDYVLQTGAAWNGPIQKADFILHLPYAINDKNLSFYVPDNGWTINGNDLLWHKEDFKPDADLRIMILDPAVWQSILTERQATALHPDDGEAWGRLGMAYKKAVWTRRGLLPDPVSVNMTQLSRQAYQNAVRLLPEDADWHYGYAELLCEIAMWDMGDPAHQTSADPNLIACIQQLKATLDLSPKHAQAWSLLRAFADPDSPWLDSGLWGHVNATGIVDISGPKPDYLILTPQPTTTLTPIPSPTAVVTVTPSPAFPLPTMHFPPLTATMTLTQTDTILAVNAYTNTPPSTPPPTNAASLTPSASASNASQPLIPAAIGLVVLAGLFAFFWLRRSRANP